MEAIQSLITSMGFPITASVGLAWFIFRIYQDWKQESATNLERMAQRCQAREDKLYEFLEESQKINAEFAIIIQKHEDKLDLIQLDLQEIKQDLEGKKLKIE